MRICFIAEGSYPYNTGGVSAWIHTLMENMPEHEFVIYAISATKKAKGHVKYKFPENVVKVEDLVLDTFLSDEVKWGGRYKLTEEEKKAVKSLLDQSSTDWDVLFSLFTSNKIDSVTNFLTSKDFFDIVQEICLEQYAQAPFTEMFWTLRSMVLPLFLSVNHPVPKADVYHSVSTGYAGVIGSLAKFYYDKPFILTEHGIYTREREEEIIKANWIKGHLKDLWIQYFYNMSNCAYEYGDEIISLFNRNKEIQAEIGCNTDKITIIPNGVPVEQYASLSNRIEKSEDDAIYIGAVVRVVPIKDIKTMLQSFAIVKREILEAQFHIMGSIDEDEEYYHDCLQLVKSLDLKDVVFTGQVNMKEKIHRMDILVLSSISEGQPLAILEGLACGIPYVSTDVGSCKELLLGENDQFGDAGIVVPIMHYVHMAQGIIRLCHDDKVRKELGKNGLNRVRAMYTKENFIQSYKKLYLSVGKSPVSTNEQSTGQQGQSSSTFGEHSSSKKENSVNKKWMKRLWQE